MKRKNIFILILFVALGILVYFNTSNNNNKVDFSKKLECQKLQYELERKLSDIYTLPLYKKVELERSFYSPVMDSCLYTYLVWSREIPSIPNYYLKDSLTNTMLYSIIVSGDTDIMAIGDLMDNFDEVVNKYSNVNTKKDDLPRAGAIFR